MSEAIQARDPAAAAALPAPPVLAIRDLHIDYHARGAVVHAVRGVDLTIHAGETLALVGESGSGKSSVAFSVMRGLDAAGRIRRGGLRFRDVDLLALAPDALRRLRGARIAMVYQDPQTSLNPAFRVGDQIAEVLRAHRGVGRREARERVHDLLRRVNLPDPERVYRRYPHELSGGQQQRILIAMAFACDPELLIMDEPTTGLDVTTEARILDLIADLKASHGTAILYITHNLGVVARFCHRVAVMYAGEIVEEGPVARVFTQPGHPYTRSLLTCVPRLDLGKRDRPLSAIEGRLPDLTDPPAGCIFEARCPARVPACAQAKPPAEPLDRDEDGRAGFVRCIRWRELPPFAFERHDGGRDAVAGERGAADAVLEAEDLRCFYPLRRGLAELLAGAPRRAVRAVDGVSLALARARTLAIVGESGCGKTTLGRAVVGLQEPTAGRLSFEGRPLAGAARARPQVQRRKVQIIFQNPDATLNPQKSVGQTLRRPLELFGLASGAAADARVAGLLRSVNLPESYAGRYPHELSGGERQRVAIARAFAADPEVIVCDEPLSALDVSVQAAILNLLVDLQRRSSTAYLFISHDLSVVRYLSDRVAVMYMGRLCEVGTPEQLFAPPYHPYTEALLSAISIPDPQVWQEKIRLEGAVPSPTDPGAGCRFASRCPRKVGGVCEREDPPVHEPARGHRIACHIPLPQLRALPAVIRYRAPPPAGETAPG
ncbi:MAG TPA: ABC transporter ATP-binding protein [Geminicoccaceae bacterium]|nr:ABC transporter ATP-binding protein [Geminicoccaceae bacterium]